MTSQQQHPNWFAASGFGQFMASSAGRWTRFIGGVVLIVGGPLVIGGTAGLIVAIVGLVPLLAGPVDVCVFSKLFGGPFSGNAIRTCVRS